MKQKGTSLLKGGFLILLFFALTLMACVVVANDISDVDLYGTCGEHITWSYNATTETLTIEGYGDMTEFEDSEVVPWKSVRASIKNAVIEEGISSIGSRAFSFCVSLKFVALPSTLVSIGSSCFYRCFDLETIDIPSSVTTIGQKAFSCCKSLKSITIPPNVTSIAKHTFQLCNSLTSVIIPSNVTSIEYASFHQCISLSSIKLPSSLTSVGQYAFHTCVSLKSVDIPPNVTVIDAGAFSGCTNLENVTFPSSLQRIGNQAFLGCISLINITIPSSVTEIEQYAFWRCSNLTYVTISNGVQKIGRSVFNECYNLTSILIPSSVTSIGTEVFGSCYNLVSIDVDSENQNYMSIDGVLFKRDKMILLHYPCAKEGDYIMPDNVTSISQYSFAGSQKLTSVNIPASVTSIGYSPFVGCPSLTSINVSSNNKKYRTIDGVLFNKAATTLIQYPCGRNETYTIPDNVTTIGLRSFRGCSDLRNVVISSSVSLIKGYAFSDCSSLLSISIPSSVTSVGIAPFFGCTSLVSINVDANNTHFVDIDGVLFDYNKSTLVQYPCGHGHSYTIPDNVTTIASFSFSKCSGLKSVTMPSTVNLILDGAFNQVFLSYVNYLGSTEPECPEPSTTLTETEFICVPMDYNATNFCGSYRVQVNSCEEFVAQHNQCYEVLEWQAEEITAKKRINATLWEQRTNECFEYQCSNTSGGIAWSKCNTTDDIHRMCIDNECIEVETMNQDKWGVEMNVNIAPNAFDLEELAAALTNATGILKVEMSIGTEALQSTGNVVRIVVYVNDQDIANTIVNFVEDRRINEECTNSILCEVDGAHILNRNGDESKDGSEESNERFFVLSSSSSKHSGFLVLMKTSMLAMIFMMFLI